MGAEGSTQKEANSPEGTAGGEQPAGADAPVASPDPAGSEPVRAEPASQPTAAEAVQMTKRSEPSEAAAAACAAGGTGQPAEPTAAPQVVAPTSAAPVDGVEAAASSAVPEDMDGPEDAQAEKNLALLGVKQRDGHKKAIEQMIALKPSDDERTVISKKVSWVLRHGAKKAGIEIDADGWVKLQDLVNWELLAQVPVERLESVIMESNEQKARYEFKDGEDGKYIRAVNKSARVKEAKDRSERHRRDGDGPSKGEWQGSYEERERYEPHERPGVMSYQDQLQAGYQPLLQDGGRVVAMVKNGISIRPGKGAPKGEGKGGDGKSEAYSSYSSGYYRQYEGEKGDGKGGYRNRDRYSRPDRVDRDDGYGGDARRQEPYHSRQKWRAVAGQDVIVRAGVEVESDKVGQLQPSSLVIQVGEEQVLENGIVRIEVETLEPAGSLRGWVTRTAEAAGGPIFFKPERGTRGQGKGGRGKGDRDRDGNKGYGKGRRLHGHDGS
mmetsp:Transcript_22156/g.40755  ORF Transcript_22156/g.40755 Transcript_22156/m.40755 type:complete len:495 (-) Transcript_22156:104-1588(-)